MTYGSRWTLSVEQHHVIGEHGTEKGKKWVDPDVHVRLHEETRKKLLGGLKSGRRGIDVSKNWYQVLLTKPVFVQSDGLVAIMAIEAEQVNNDISGLIQDAFALGRQFERQQAPKEKK